MLELRKNKTYILACSFGPDSMALFNMLLVEGYKIVVAHVNYHKREESDAEERGLRSFCEKHKVICEVLSVEKKDTKGNFQTWARVKRYEFFKTVYQKYCAKGLFVAHQEDDVIETYLMQLKRKTEVSFYGIAVKTELFNMDVYRPLLNYPKKELLNYCLKNEIPFAIDASNQSDIYTRNVIRREQVELLTDEEKKRIIEDIKLRNREIEIIEKTINSYPKNNIVLEKLLKEPKQIIFRIIQGLPRKNNIDYAFSKRCAIEILKAIKTEKANIELFRNNVFTLIKSYNQLMLVDNVNTGDYEYILEKPGILAVKEFTLDLNLFKGFIKEEDFPLCVRATKTHDQVKIGIHIKKVSRLFIEWKLPRYLRKIWPVVINNQGDIVYIPRFRQDMNKRIKIIM